MKKKARPMTVFLQKIKNIYTKKILSDCKHAEKHKLTALHHLYLFHLVITVSIFITPTLCEIPLVKELNSHAHKLPYAK